MRVLITGGAGSVGRELARLAQADHSVRVFDLPTCDYGRFADLPGVEIVKGDILDPASVGRAVAGVDTVVHLAALLPPASERDRQLTMSINVGGTENLVAALAHENPSAHLVLSSSVCVYGDTSEREQPIRVSQPRRAVDHYAESKIAAEDVVVGASLPYTILRISGVAVPAFLTPPDIWPFMAEQRIEFVCRRDVVAALAACIHAPPAVGKTFNVAGGATWRMSGAEYAVRFNEVMGLAPEDAIYSERRGYFDWYDTVESQATLKYQNTSFARFLVLLEQAIEEVLGGSEEE